MKIQSSEHLTMKVSSYLMWTDKACKCRAGKSLQPQQLRVFQSADQSLGLQGERDWYVPVNFYVVRKLNIWLRLLATLRFSTWWRVVWLSIQRESVCTEWEQIIKRSMWKSLYCDLVSMCLTLSFCSRSSCLGLKLPRSVSERKIRFDSLDSETEERRETCSKCRNRARLL